MGFSSSFSFGFGSRCTPICLQVSTGTGTNTHLSRYPPIVPLSFPIFEKRLRYLAIIGDSGAIPG